MATIFLANPAGALSLEVLKTFRALKSLPDDFYVWHHLAKWEMEAPDFLVRTAQNQAILIKVSLANSQAARPAAQLLLMETKQPPLGAAEEAVLHEFLSGVKLYFRATSPSQIRAVVLFPNIEAKRLKQGTSKLPIRPSCGGVRIISKWKTCSGTRNSTPVLHYLKRSGKACGGPSPRK